jgi:hypothetical protein
MLVRLEDAYLPVNASTPMFPSHVGSIRSMKGVQPKGGAKFVSIPCWFD